MNQENNKSNFPTEIVKLPSKGLVYPKENPLSSGEIEMKYMTAKEEDILTNINYIRDNTVLDKLLKSLIVSNINLDDLITEDRDALLYAARVLGYGKDYTFRYINPNTGKEEDVTVDLTALKEREFDGSILTELNKNELSYKFNTSNNSITFKFLTVKDEKDIEKELQGLKKISPTAYPEITTRLKYLITSVNGDPNKSAIREFVDNFLLAKDSREFRKYIKTVSPGIEMKFNFVSENYTEEGVDIPMTVNFFWPEF